MAVVSLACATARAQEWPGQLSAAWREPLLPGALDQARREAGPTGSPSGRDSRFRLFRMTPGYLSDPVGLDDSDGTGYDPGALAEGPSFGRVQVTLGADNPFFDFRRAGDPGGVGFYRLYTQYQVLEAGRTGCTLGLQAVAPAGLEGDGVADGPTVFSPNLGWFYDLGGGMGLHGFLGKHVRAAGGWTDGWSRHTEYGVAFHRAIPWLDDEGAHTMFLFVEALGHRSSERQPDPGRAGVWEVLPGLHWRMSETWWLTGGYLMPVGPARSDAGRWQLTCSWQF